MFTKPHPQDILQSSVYKKMIDRRRIRSQTSIRNRNSPLLPFKTTTANKNCASESSPCVLGSESAPSTAVLVYIPDVREDHDLQNHHLQKPSSLSELKYTGMLCLFSLS